MLRSGTAGNENRLVLLIEDNTDDERLTLRALRKNNVMNEVVVAYDGQEAIDYLFAQGKFLNRDTSLVPSLIILDLRLPKVSGLEVLEQIRSRDDTQYIPVIVLTANEDSTQIKAAYKAGANSYVRKPSDPEEYSETILNLAMYWLLMNRLPEG